MNKLIKILIKPQTSMIGSVLFCFIWFAIGTINDLALLSDIDNIEIPEGHKYMSWKKDYLGHYLTALTLLASTSFWFYYQFISNMLKRKTELKSRALEAVRWWFFPALIVCVIFVINNVYYITYGSKLIVHWSHVLLPLWMPLIISSFYYLGVVFPLLLSIISYSVLLNYCAQNCTKMAGFSHNDKKYLFGIGKFGDAIILSLIFVILFLIPPLIIQYWQKNEATIGSIISVPVSLLIIFSIFIKPLKDTAINLQHEKKRLANIKQDKIDLLNEKIDNNTSTDIEITLKLIQKEENELDLIKAQKVIPVSRKLTIVSLITITPVIFINALKWVKEFIELFK